MRALVTGACGFVGGHLVRHLVESGDSVVGTVLRSGKIDAECETRTLDVTDPKAVASLISQVKPEVIYHLAGLAFVPDAEEDFDKALRINVAGTHHLYRTCHLLQAGITVVLVSSAEVYGRVSSSDLPLKEETVVRPANNYSLSKVMGELAAARYEQYGYLRSIVMRPFNHLGAGQNDKFVASSFARQLAQIKKGISAPVLRVGNLAAKRDFSDVRDIVRAYRLGAQKGQGTYNLCSGVPVAIQAILDTLIEISGLKVRIEQDPTRMRAADLPELYGSYERAKADLGWTPQITLRETLESVYRYWEQKEMAS